MDKNNFSLLLLVIIGGFAFCYIALHKIESSLQECLRKLYDLDAIKENMEAAVSSLEAIEQRANPRERGQI